MHHRCRAVRHCDETDENCARARRSCALPDATSRQEIHTRGCLLQLVARPATPRHRTACIGQVLRPTRAAGTTRVENTGQTPQDHAIASMGLPATCVRATDIPTT